MEKIFCLIGLILLLPSCSYLNKMVGLPDDNIIEQVIEDVIKEESGTEIDLTQEKK